MYLHISAAELEVGHIIVEGKHETKVVQLDKERCKNHVHVNNKDCYDSIAQVKIHGSKRYNPNFDETESHDGVFVNGVPARPVSEADKAMIRADIQRWAKDVVDETDMAAASV